MKRAIFGAVVILVILGAAVHWRPDRALKVASGLTAHNLCSAAFIAGLDPQPRQTNWPSPCCRVSCYSPEPNFGISEDLKVIDAAIKALRAR
jgi:hypothetical protein